MTRENKVKDVFHITEREGRKPVWSKVGIAFVNRDNSLNVILNSIPIDGKLHIRERKETMITTKEAI